MKKLTALLLTLGVLATVACSNNPAEYSTDTAQSILTVKTALSGICSFSARGNGEALFSVRLPSGQAYVEIFVRQNGLQNVAQNIVSSEHVIGDGTSYYTLSRYGFKPGDRIEYRFYSYLPASPGLFSPGPSEGVWKTEIYGNNTFTTVSEAETITNVYTLGSQTENGQPISYELVTSISSSSAQGMFTGWGLYRAQARSSNVTMTDNFALLVGFYIKKAGQSIYVPVNETAYNYYSLSTAQTNGRFYWFIPAGGSVEPAGMISTTFEENIVYGTVSTYIGNQTIPVSGTATFAYLIKHYSLQD